MAKVTVIQNQKSNQFSNERTYKWDPEDVFEITGQQFATLYHALLQEMMEKGGAPLQLKYEAYNVVSEMLKRGVEQGVIVETSIASIAGEVSAGMKDVEKGVNNLFKTK